LIIDLLDYALERSEAEVLVTLSGQRVNSLLDVSAEVGQ